MSYPFPVAPRQCPGCGAKSSQILPVASGNPDMHDSWVCTACGNEWPMDDESDAERTPTTVPGRPGDDGVN